MFHFRAIFYLNERKDFAFQVILTYFFSVSSSLLSSLKLQVDWWSLGALLYEMLTGLPPFYCRDREKLFEKIRSAELTYPKYLTRQAVGLLKGLLTRDPAQRLGSGPTDAQEVSKYV